MKNSYREKTNLLSPKIVSGWSRLRLNVIWQCAVVMSILGLIRAHADPPIPEYYGVYVVSDGKLFKADSQEKWPGDVQISVGDVPRFADVYRGNRLADISKGSVTIFKADLQIVVYSQPSGLMTPQSIAEHLKIRAIPYVRQVTFDITELSSPKVSRRGLWNAWGRDLSMGKVELGVKPLSGRTDMVTAVPKGDFVKEGKLANGIYELVTHTGRKWLFSVGAPDREAEERSSYDIWYLGDTTLGFTDIEGLLGESPFKFVKSQRSKIPSTGIPPPTPSGEEKVSVPTIPASGSPRDQWQASITERMRMLVSMPPLKTDWRELATMKATDKFDTYESLYLLGVNRRNLAADALNVAQEFLKKDDLAKVEKWVKTANQFYIESEALFKAANDVAINSAEAALNGAKALEPVIKGGLTLGELGVTLACGGNQLCGESASVIVMMIEYGLDSSIYGKQEAQRNVVAKAVAKALFQVDGVGAAIEKRTTYVIGRSGLYSKLDEILANPDFQKQVMKVLAETGAFTVTAETEAVIAEAIKKMDSFVMSASNLQPGATAQVQQQASLGDGGVVVPPSSSAGASVRAPAGPDMTTPVARDIVRAADLQRWKTVADLIQKNPEYVNVRNTAGTSPLHYAAYAGDKALAEFLLANRADVNIRNNNNVTPLQLAVIGGRVEMVEFLLGQNAEVNTKTTDEYGNTPLHNAAITGNKQIVELLLAKGADPKATNGQGKTPLDIATEKRRKAVEEVLRNHAAAAPAGAGLDIPTGGATLTLDPAVVVKDCCAATRKPDGTITTNIKYEVFNDKYRNKTLQYGGTVDAVNESKRSLMFKGGGNWPYNWKVEVLFSNNAQASLSQELKGKELTVEGTLTSIILPSPDVALLGVGPARVIRLENARIIGGAAPNR